MMKLKKGEFTVIHTPTMDYLSAIELGVYAWLCHYTNQDGVCFPSLNRLSVNAKMTVRGVIGVLKRLDQKGAIKKSRRINKKQGYTSTLYAVMILPTLVNVGNKPTKQGSLPLVNVGNKNQIKDELKTFNYKSFTNKNLKRNDGLVHIGKVLQEQHG